MTFVIVTDSASDTPYQFKNRDDVYVAMTSIIIREHVYLDNELSIDDLLKKFSHGEHSTTSQPSPKVFQDCYNKAIETGLPVLGIHVSSKMSGTFNGARVTAETFDSSDILIFDTMNISFGSGYFVMLACVLKDKGFTRDQVFNIFSKLRSMIHLELLISDIQYLRRGGRVNLSQYWLLTSLRLKPILNVRDGKLVRGSLSIGMKGGMQKIVNRIQSSDLLPDRALIAVGHVNTPGLLKQLADKSMTLVDHTQIFEVQISATLLSHAGPNAIGMMIAPSIDYVISLMQKS